MRRFADFTAALFYMLYGCAMLFAQAPGGQYPQVTNRLQLGVELYGQGRWGDAIVELRRAQAENPANTARAEAQFWIAMSELSAGKFQESIHSFDEIVRLDPLSARRLEVPYQKARALFYLGRFNEAIVLFRQYADSIQVDGRYIQGARADTWIANPNNNDAYNRKASAVYWIGECLYNLEQWDKAGEMFDIVVRQYPMCLKYEISTNRLALIKQKKTEEGLLEIIRLSATTPPPAQPSLPQRDAPYEDAVLAYKNSIAPFLMQQPEEEQKAKPRRYGSQPPEVMMRLLNIKTEALEMMDRLTSTLNTFETLEWERW